MTIYSHKCHETCCPFAFTPESDQAQGYGCLPTPYEFIKAWKDKQLVVSCHEDITKKCVGFLIYAKEHKLGVKPKSNILPNFGNNLANTPDVLATWKTILGD